MFRRGSLIVVTLVFAFLCSSLSSAVPVTSCQTISGPGLYTLTQNVVQTGASPCIFITSNDVIFDGRGFSITRDTALSTSRFAVQVESVSNVSVINTGIATFDYGIYLSGVSNSYVFNNTIANISLVGIYPYLSSSVTVANNTLRNAFYAVSAQYGSSHIIRHNKLLGSGYGVSLYGTSQNSVSWNNITGSTRYAVYVQTSASVSTPSNTIDNNFGTGNAGLINPSVPIDGNVYTNNFAAPIVPGISSCQNIGASGSYFLTQDLVAASGLESCLGMATDNIYLDGRGRKIIAANADGTFGEPHGVYIYSKRNITVVNLVIENFSSGIFIRYSDNLTFVNNTITKSKSYGLVARDGPGTGMRIINNTFSLSLGTGISLNPCGDYAIITGNTFYNLSQIGIAAYSCDSVNVTKNTFVNTNASAIDLEGVSNAFIFNNSLYYSNNAIFLYGTTLATVRYNYIFYSEGSALTCIFCSNSSIFGNTALVQTHGFFFDNSSSNSIKNNTITSTLNYAFAVMYGSSNNVVQYNTGSLNGALFYPPTPTDGNQYLANFLPPYPVHPADTNYDSIMDASEFSLYNLNYKLLRPWPDAPSPPSSTFYSRALLLFKLGGFYHYESTKTCPLCWVNGTA